MVLRILFYYAYLAEELVGPPFTIGVGCLGTGANGRCKFQEFLKYVMKDADGRLTTILDDSTQSLDTLLEKPRSGGALWEFLDIPYSTLENNIERWPNLGKVIVESPDQAILTKDVTLERVVAGAADYGDLLGKVTLPIGHLQSIADASRIAKWGEIAAQVNYDLRSLDFQDWKIPAVRAQLELLRTKAGIDHPFEMATLDSRNTQKMSPHQIFDYSGTVKLNAASTPDFASLLDQALDNWERGADRIGPDGKITNQVKIHRAVLDKAWEAEVNCRCV